MPRMLRQRERGWERGGRGTEGFNHRDPPGKEADTHPDGTAVSE